MKKTLAIVLCLMMIVSAMSVAQLSVSAANSADIVVDTKTAKPGDTVSVEVNMKNCTGIIGLYLELQYDTSRLELKSVKPSDKPAGFTPSQNLTDTPYMLTWNSAESEDFTGDFLLVTLEFTVKANAANGDAKIQIAKSAEYGDDAAYDVNFGQVALNITEGAITVEGGSDAPVTDAPTTTAASNDTTAADNNSTNTGDYIIPVVAIALVAAVAVTVFATKKRSNRA